MKPEIWKKIIKTGSLITVFCFSLSFIFGVLVQASIPQSPMNVFSSNPNSNNIDTGNSVIEFGKEKVDNFIMPDSQSNYVDISAKVYVKHYHRRDGTPVKSHYRRDPR
jgi:hypothetical protein